jgi:L-ascorbate metabolism protein UlaG (beta-lactamase superfamily)
MTVTKQDVTIDWLGYATIRIETDDAVVYMDPGRHGALDDYRAEDGDLVCVTHDHHYDPDGIDRVANDDALVVVYEGVDASRITGREAAPVDELPYAVERIDEYERFDLWAGSVTAVPAYNPPGTPHTDEDGEPMHARGFGVGFRLETAGESLFWPGDTDVIPEHRDLDPTILLPPIGGTFTMDRHGAADLAGQLGPDLVLPVHYDTFPAIEADSGAFAAEVARRGVPVVLDEPAGR